MRHRGGIEASSIDWGMDDRAIIIDGSRHWQNEASMFAKSHSPKSDFQKVSQNLLLRNVHWMIRFESLRIALRICVRSSQVAQVEKMKVNSPPFAVDEPPRSWRAELRNWVEKLKRETVLRNWIETPNWEMLETLRHSNWSLEAKDSTLGWMMKIIHKLRHFDLNSFNSFSNWLRIKRWRPFRLIISPDHFASCGEDPTMTWLRHN